MLIPTVLALSDFFIKNFPNISWYPYWYLGNPYHYLVGPVVPVALWVVRGVGEVGGIGVPLEGAYLWLIFASFLLGGFGIFLLLRDWGVEKRAAILSGILYIVLPAGFFLLNYQNGLNHIAFGFLPYALILYRRFLLSKSRLLMVLMALMIVLILLTNVSTFLPLAVGFIALFISTGSINGKEDKMVKTILIILLSLFLSTLWYTPKFWWVIATNPSLGGVPFGKLIWSIFQFLFQFLPIVLAIVVVKWRRFNIKGYFLFGILFFFSFLFLSIVRFVNDPDFVMDWVSFGLELQFGGAIILGNIKYTLRLRSGQAYQRLKIISLIIGFILLLIADFLIISTVFKDNTRNDYQSFIISILEKNVKENERVFLSGSSVFFINSKLNIQQPRGGVDQSSIHPFWAHGAYQIREGTSENLAYDWFRALGVSYVLVHDKGSQEQFHDFKYPEKFTQFCHSDPPVGGEESHGILRRSAPQDDRKCLGAASFELVEEDHGDRLYRINGVSIGRVADESILNVQKPKNGADNQAINNYTSSFKRPLAVKYQKPNEIAISGNIKQGEIISLAISYDMLWDIAYGKGTITSDPLGNMAIIPKKTGLQRFELVYKRSLHDLAITMGLSIIIVIILVYYQKIVPYVRKRIPKLSIGLEDKDGDY